ncbi:MAG: hypothetical protein GW939_01660 [Candidatus Magasanikbacteria bacterium]|nr:hypothetical protein [Candidatus Magasanikbacteria bacterium]NCS71727.1 hypothetical protein [Candidatus Magasanikbacteria bacterium]
METRKSPEQSARDTNQTSPKEQLFGIIESGKFQDNVAQLEEAIQAKELDTIATHLRGQQLEQMIIQKGPEGKFLRIVMDAVDAVAKEQTGKQLVEITDPKDIQQILNAGKSGLSPFALAEYCAASYHTKQDTSVFQIGRILTEFQQEQPLMAAHALNCIASSYDRQGMPLAAQQHNRDALTLLNTIPQGRQDQNTEWAKMKIRHGLLHQRSEQKPHQDMIDQYLELAEQRKVLGDTAHVGRTYLDAGRLASTLGETNQAIAYLSTAIEELENTGYTNALIQAYEAFAKLRQQNGEDRRAKQLFWKGVGVGERMKHLLQEDLERMQKEKEHALKIPATCLVELVEDTFLVENITQDTDFPQFMGIVVDQEKTKNAEGTIRKKLENIINTILHARNQDVATEHPISVSARSAQVFIREKGPEKTYFSYKASFRNPQEGIEAIVRGGLDKTPKDGYAVLSWQDLLTYRDHFDERTQILIDKEQERRTSNS